MIPPFHPLGRQFWNAFYKVLQRVSKDGTTGNFRRGQLGNSPSVSLPSIFPAFGITSKINYFNVGLCLRLYSSQPHLKSPKSYLGIQIPLTLLLSTPGVPLCLPAVKADAPAPVPHFIPKDGEKRGRWVHFKGRCVEVAHITCFLLTSNNLVIQPLLVQSSQSSLAVQPNVCPGKMLVTLFQDGGWGKQILRWNKQYLPQKQIENVVMYINNFVKIFHLPSGKNPWVTGLINKP